MKKLSRKQKERIVFTILIIIFAGIFIFSAVKLIQNFVAKNDEIQSQGELVDEFLVQTEATSASGTDGLVDPTQTLASTEEDSTDYTAPAQTEETLVSGDVTVSIWPNFSVDWDKLLTKNKDVVGWIWIYGTSINYPVLKGADNGTYLYSALDKTYTRSGSIFMDYRQNSDFSSPNTLIYGHNYLGLKFNPLMDYNKQSFYDSRKYICMFTPDGKMQKYAIYSAYTTNIYSDTFKLDFESEQDYQSFLNYTVSSSYIQTGIVPTTADRVITLCTCTNSYKEERFVVHAIPIS